MIQLRRGVAGSSAAALQTGKGWTMMRSIMFACAVCLATPALAQPQQQQTPAPAVQPPVQLLVTPRAETCGIFVRQDAEHVSYIITPGYTVLTAVPPLARPPGQPQVDAIICDRESIVIGPADYHVLTDLHVPFYIRNAGRLAVLEITDGRLQARFLRGQPTPAESQAMAAALDRSSAEAARTSTH